MIVIFTDTKEIKMKPTDNNVYDFMSGIKPAAPHTEVILHVSSLMILSAVSNTEYSVLKFSKR